MKYDLIIIGAGPGGATAGIYAKRQGLNVLIIEKGAVGGQLAESPEIENYPGFPKISGMQYGEKIKLHLDHLEIPIMFGEVTEIKKTNGEFKVVVYDKEYSSKTIILATGTKHKHLDVKGEKEFYGKGISYCATCDGFFFKGKDVAVVGGGNSALYYADYLSNITSKVYLIHRRQEFRGEPVLVDKLSKKNNVKFILDSVIDSFNGSKILESISIKNIKSNKIDEIKLSGVFVSVGEMPNIELAKQLKLELDDKEYIKTNDKQETNVKGVYACGDVCGKGWAQAINASAQGMTAALECSSSIRKQ